ncbi:uncharacterized protein LTHEOB_2659 [Neofusicoccum parvum]|nr:uncharacterized protein LTHEOB_2659 [Neofusicoccum parvum]
MPPTQENPSPPPASKRTNCGRLTYRFSYAAHKVTLQTPCFEPTCNTCARAQPAVAAFEDSPSAASPPPHYQDVLDAQQRELVRRRRERCEREVGERLRRVGELAVANAAAVKETGGEFEGEREAAAAAAE